jgi:hypothetical protein
MTRIIEKTIKTKCQILDSEADPVTTATVNYKIYAPDGDEEVVIDSGAMTHIGDGIYQVVWIPFQGGHHAVECYSSNPKFRQTFVYLVHDPLTHRINNQFVNGQNNTFNLANNTDEQEIAAFNSDPATYGFPRFWKLYLDVSGLGQDATIRVYVTINSERLLRTIAFTAGSQAVVEIDMGICFRPWRVTIQSAIAQAASMPWDLGVFNDINTLSYQDSEAPRLP